MYLHIENCKVNLFIDFKMRSLFYRAGLSRAVFLSVERDGRGRQESDILIEK